MQETLCQFPFDLRSLNFHHAIQGSRRISGSLFGRPQYENRRVK